MLLNKEADKSLTQSCSPHILITQTKLFMFCN